jgi:hypothetical protein
MIADGAGGAMIAWHDRRLAQHNIYGQRVDSNGTIQWATNGEAVFDNPLACGSSFGYHNITTDGAGGLILAVTKFGAGVDVVAQRVDNNGNYLWDACGELVCGAAINQEHPQIVPDGSGGAIIAWPDTRNLVSEMYAQRINASGSILWTPDGEPVCTGAGSLVDPEFGMVSDGVGGAVLGWSDYNSSHLGIYAQRIDASGTTLWAANGELVITGEAFWPEMVSDISNGAIVVWNDGRAGGGNVDLYAQRLNCIGTKLWTANGVAVTTAPDIQEFPTIVTDGFGGAIIGWEDNRTSTSFDIYTQQITGDGILGGPHAVPTLSKWGLVFVVMVLLAAGVAVIRKRKVFS